jgi:hypothetical protein
MRVAVGEIIEQLANMDNEVDGDTNSASEIVEPAPSSNNLAGLQQLQINATPSIARPPPAQHQQLPITIPLYPAHPIQQHQLPVTVPHRSAPPVQ